MINENNLVNLSNLPKEQRNILFNQLLALQVQEDNERLNKLESYAKLEIEKTRNTINQLDTKLDTKIIEIEQNALKNEEKKQFKNNLLNSTHVVLSSLGLKHDPPVGARYMGHLLRVVGVARQNRSFTTPKSQFLGANKPLVIPTDFDGHAGWAWHYERTWSAINNRLIKMGVFMDFNVCKNQKEIHGLIKKLMDDNNIYDESLEGEDENV